MPKTSKKSKASKSTGLKKKFDLSSKKVQFFVVIAIVALLGGGWFTYKSFAATKTLFGSDVLQCSHQYVVSHNETCQTISDPAKNNASVKLLTGKKYTATNPEPSYVVTSTTATMSPWNRYKVCVTAKGVGSILPSFHPGPSHKKGVLVTANGYGSSINFNNSNNYSTQCATNTPLDYNGPTQRYHVHIRPRSSNTFLTISQITVEKISPQVSTGAGGGK